MGSQTPENVGSTATATDSAERPLRRDAERNRQLILQAARELFAERGLSVTLDDIAAHAGVGVGTVYRRFASRDVLVDALFTERINDLVANAEAALAFDDPWDGLVAFMRGHMQFQTEDRSFASVVMSDVHGRDAIDQARKRLEPAVEKLVVRAHDAGLIRPDLAVADVPMIVTMLGAVLDATRDLAPTVWERYFTIVLDGIRATCATPLPVAALTPEQVPEAMRASFSNRR